MSPAPLDALFLDLFPDSVRVAWRRLEQDERPAFRFGAEAAVVEGAVAKRQIEFAAGRELFHRLHEELRREHPDLAELAPLLPAGDRGPVWPEGLVGAISHTAGLCVVAVARTADHTRLGLDVEVTEPLKEKLWPQILTVSERARLKGLGRRGVLLSKLHFSGKEAI